jgi:aryl-alcohol dehydrogenase-like predicted oxidoreductase
MTYRPLGRTGLTVSTICLGTMTYGEQNTEADAFAQMDYALEHGVNFLDTAELYAPKLKRRVAPKPILATGSKRGAIATR